MSYVKKWHLLFLYWDRCRCVGRVLYWRSCFCLLSAGITVHQMPSWNTPHPVFYQGFRDNSTKILLVKIYKTFIFCIVFLSSRCVLYCSLSGCELIWAFPFILVFQWLGRRNNLLIYFTSKYIEMYFVVKQNIFENKNFELSMVIHACYSSILGLRWVGRVHGQPGLHCISCLKRKNMARINCLEAHFTKVPIPVMLINFKL